MIFPPNKDAYFPLDKNEAVRARQVVVQCPNKDGKGFSQYIMVVGLCETVALFALVFSMVALG